MSNNTKKCPKCREEIDKKASVCPKCQSKIGGMGWGMGLFILFAGIALIGIIAPDIPKGNGMIEACSYSQTEIEGMLKSPSTAEHPVCTEGYHSVAGNTHTFESYVDSQNGFGAVTRTQYTCTVILDGSSEYSIKCKPF